VSNYGDFDDAKIKHLEMIQAVVTRLANEAALIRGLALTVAAAFFGFSVPSLNWRIAAVGMLPVVAFWGLNAYYLRADRQFRKFYDRVRRGEPNIEPFAMNAREEEVETGWQVAWSVTLRPFYGVIAIVGLTLIVAGLVKDLCS
jgi:hypothetical protein